jgi:hypothetical protein
MNGIKIGDKVRVINLHSSDFNRTGYIANGEMSFVLVHYEVRFDNGEVKSFSSAELEKVGV